MRRLPRVPAGASSNQYLPILIGVFQLVLPIDLAIASDCDCLLAEARGIEAFVAACPSAENEICAYSADDCRNFRFDCASFPSHAAAMRSAHDACLRGDTEFTVPSLTTHRGTANGHVINPSEYCTGATGRFADSAGESEQSGGATGASFTGVLDTAVSGGAESLASAETAFNNVRNTSLPSLRHLSDARDDYPPVSSPDITAAVAAELQFEGESVSPSINIWGNSFASDGGTETSDEERALQSPDGHSESALDLGGLLAGESLGPSASQSAVNQHNDFAVDSAPVDRSETGGYDPADELDELGNDFLPDALRGVLDETLQDDETSEARGNDAPATPESDENEERSLVSGRIECVSVTMNVTRISCESPGCPVFENVCTEGLQVYYYLAGDIGGTGGFSLAPGEVHDTWRRVVPGARVVFAACPISVPYPVSDNGEFWGQRNPGRFLCRGGS